MKVKMPRKRVTVVVATAMALALGGGVAYAYFTAAGTGTGHATVGTSGTWTVSAAAPQGSIVPGTGTSTILFTLTNANAGGASQTYDAITATVDSSGGNITEGATTVAAGTARVGCLATWFTATVGTPSPALHTAIAANGTGSVTVTVAMPANALVNQDVCKNAVPDIAFAVDPVV